MSLDLSGPNLEIVLGDALDFDLGEAARKACRPLVVGNVPCVVTWLVLFATIEAAAGASCQPRQANMLPARVRVLGLW